MAAIALLSAANIQTRSNILDHLRLSHGKHYRLFPTFLCKSVSLRTLRTLYLLQFPIVL
jgi:hypothetical protein